MTAKRVMDLEEVAKHNKEGDCWIVIDGKVYDVSQFLSEHPGGKKVILRVGGKDATVEFHKFHKVEEVLQKYGPKLYLGNIASANSSETESESKDETHHNDGEFGDMIPYGDPSWYQGHRSPFFKETHIRYRAAVREIIERELMPHVMGWDEARQPPSDIWKKMAQWGLLAALMGNTPWPAKYAGNNIAGGVSPDEFDGYHSYILADELGRTASFGFCGLFAGIALALPPIFLFGSDYLKDKVLTPCLHGEKVPCLAITEPTAGSDVAAIKTEAKLSPCGKFYIVNGEKKFITAGHFADFFITAVRTGGEGMGGLSLMVIERSQGVNTRRMDCQGMWCSGTAYVTFEDVKVPVENLIGEENGGFMYIMYNFNKERLGMIIQATRFARVCYEESFKYAHKRKTFGKRLIDHPVIRNKLAHMARQIEATQTWVDHIVYQAQVMPFEEAQSKLAGSVALLKVQTSVTFEFCAREASQIFGGLAYTRVGQGEKVERMYRDVRGIAIPGGSEEILLDLGIRQAMRLAKQANAKL